ncbi:hypothetical protein ACA910_002055 [Epithemia clementina (nom. ined.)]
MNSNGDGNNRSSASLDQENIFYVPQILNLPQQQQRPLSMSGGLLGDGSAASFHSRNARDQVIVEMLQQQQRGPAENMFQAQGPTSEFYGNIHQLRQLLGNSSAVPFLVRDPKWPGFTPLNSSQLIRDTPLAQYTQSATSGLPGSIEQNYGVFPNSNTMLNSVAAYPALFQVPDSSSSRLSSEQFFLRTIPSNRSLPTGTFMATYPDIPHSLLDGLLSPALTSTAVSQRSAATSAQGMLGSNRPLFSMPEITATASAKTRSLQSSPRVSYEIGETAGISLVSNGIARASGGSACGTNLLTGRSATTKSFEKASDYDSSQTHDNSSRRNKRKYEHESFAQKLHRIVTNLENEGNEDIMSFLDEGGLWVHEPDIFVKEIMPKYFRGNTWASFRRQLFSYQFPIVKHGRHKGAFQNPHFLRGRPELCARIIRDDKYDKKKST